MNGAGHPSDWCRFRSSPHFDARRRVSFGKGSRNSSPVDTRRPPAYAEWRELPRGKSLHATDARLPAWSRPLRLAVSLLALTAAGIFSGLHENNP